MDTTLLVAFISEILGVVAVTMLLALSPRLAPLPIAFPKPRREMMFALGLFALALLVDILLPLLPDWNPGPSYPLLAAGEINSEARDALVQRLMLDWIALLPFGVVLAMCDRCQPFPSIGWNKRDLRPALQLGFALGLITLFLTARIFALFDGIALADLYALLVWVGIGLTEETIFRGYIQPRLSANWGARSGWLVTAGLYTLYYLPGLIGRSDLALQLAIVLVRGLVLGWIMQKTGHVLAGGLWRGISGWARFI